MFNNSLFSPLISDSKKYLLKLKILEEIWTPVVINYFVTHLKSVFKLILLLFDYLYIYIYILWCYKENLKAQNFGMYQSILFIPLLPLKIFRRIWVKRLKIFMPEKYISSESAIFLQYPGQILMFGDNHYLNFPSQVSWTNFP